MNPASKGIAVVTGASAGIGAVYSERLAQRGYNLLLVARNVERLEKLARTIAGSTGRKVQILGADLSDAADLAKVEQRLREDQQVTMLVNNAGVGATAPLLNSDIGAMTQMIRLNVEVLTRLTCAAVPGLVARGSGTIINTASIAAMALEILNGEYGGTKAFVLAFSHSLKHELADKEIRVQVALPGETATNFWSTAGTPVEHLPQEIVMPVEAMVDAALAGLDQGEFATIPALPDAEQCTAYETARIAKMPNLSRTAPADRYGSISSRT